MIRFKQGKILVVAPATSLIPIPANKSVIHIANAGRIFPVINEFKPDGIMLDHDYLGNDTEKVLRRLAANPFYSKIKVYCYKSASNTKVDGFLKVLGVQYFIYAEDEKKQAKQKNNTVKALSEMLEASMISTLADAGY
ncbi:MAG: hypothetical protein V4592_04535 [Bacteroidota bacterium]